jgi:hypothetical protein
MNSTKTKTTVALGTVLALIVSTMILGKGKQAQAAELEKEKQAASVTTALEKVKEANVDLPDSQAQAKALIITAMIQKSVPAAAYWCETLNVNHKLWPVAPTNISFALNSAVAGRIYSKTNRPAGDVVVFFESSRPGWNLVGGPELLAKRPGGVVVAFGDGSSSIVTPAEVARLRWKP